MEVSQSFVDNIVSNYNLSTKVERAEGVLWYANARNVCIELSKKYEVSFYLTCYVCAALSPNNKWHRNITDLNRVLQLFVIGTLSTKVKAYENGNKDALKNIACTYTSNLIKAYKILETKNVSHLGNGLKTNNFAKNIFYKHDKNVTVDLHAVSVAKNFRFTVETIKATSFRKKQYTEIANAYIQAGEDLKILPKFLQAITWVSWRNRQEISKI